MMRSGMIIDILVTFAGICVDIDLNERRKFVEELMAHLFCDEVSLQY